MNRRNSSEPKTHRFGAHLSIAGGVSNALRAALALRCDTVQVFVKNQRQWAARPLDPDEVAAWHALLSTAGFGPAIAHATYLINLASPDNTLWRKSVAAFAEELMRCTTLGIPYLVVHPGSPGETSRTAALRRVARALDQIYDRQPDLTTRVALETTAGQGTTLGRTFEELGSIIDAARCAERLAVCVDTCHVFAAGYDLRSAEGYAVLVDEAERTIGLERICCWHFNDSQGALGSHRDRHAHIGCGEIGRAGFRHILRDTRFVGVPMILETPKGTDERDREWDAVNLSRLRRMAASLRRR